jgi:hypothetical protein
VKIMPSGHIWGPINAEDLVSVPGTSWIITSGMTGPSAPIGRIYAVSARDGSCNEICPYLLDHALDRARFGALEPLDGATLQPHGIDVVIRSDGVPELLVVNHGARESVEVFEILLGGRRPALRWIGGVEMPGTAVGNDVAAVAGGGFVVSTTGNLDGKSRVSREQTLAGADTGGVLEWSPVEGWRLLPGTQINVANGVAVSADGEWVFIGGWGDCSVKKVRRGAADPEVKTVRAPIKVDNFTWSETGALIAAGAFGASSEEFLAGHFSESPRLAFPTRVISIDPDTLAIDILIEYGTEAFGVGTTGLQVGDEIWVGAARDHGIARFPFQTAAQAS